MDYKKLIVGLRSIIGDQDRWTAKAIACWTVMAIACWTAMAIAFWTAMAIAWWTAAIATACWTAMAIGLKKFGKEIDRHGNESIQAVLEAE